MVVGSVSLALVLVSIEYLSAVQTPRDALCQFSSIVSEGRESLLQ